MKRSIWSAAVIWAAGVLSGSAATIYTQGFNSATIPADWATEIVNQPSVPAPALTFVTASTYPSGFAPYEGTHFVRFNSYTCDSGSSIRLKRTAGLSTLGYAGVMVQFAWARDAGYSSRNDSVTVQYSTNGTTWVSAGTYSRYGSGAARWELNTCMLPAGAAGKATVYIAFLFTSDYGNDCHLDAVSVLSTDSAPPDAFAAAGASASQINLTWALNAAGHTVLIASNGVDVFGAPASGTVYNAGSALPGGGGIIYKGTGTAFAHTGLAPETLRYYRAWSVNSATQYSDSVAASARTFPAPITVFPYHESFESGWGAWRASEGFNFAWERWQGPTPSDGTGPNHAHDGMWYAYTESSSPNNPGKTAGLYAYVSFAGVTRPALDCYYHLYGATMGTLAVDVFDGVWRTGV